MTTRFEQLYRARLAAGKYVCVGLDPDIRQHPGNVTLQDSLVHLDVVEFVTGIVRATK